MNSDALAAHRFRYGLLAFDIITVLFVIASSFTKDLWWVEALDVVFGLAILTDFLARLAISRHRLRDLLHPATWVDVVAILSFLAPLAGEAGGFLRVLRTLRLLQSYEVLSRLRTDVAWFRRNEELAISAVHLVVFLFVMTGVVYANSAFGRNPGDPQLCRRPVFYCDSPYHYWPRRHNPAWHRRSAHLRRHHDLRSDPLPPLATIPSTAA